MINVAVVGNSADRFEYFLTQVAPVYKEKFRFILVADVNRVKEVGKTIGLVTMISAIATHREAEEVMMKLRLYVVPYIEPFDFTKETAESLQKYL